TSGESTPLRYRQFPQLFRELRGIRARRPRLRGRVSRNSEETTYNLAPLRQLREFRLVPHVRFMQRGAFDTLPGPCIPGLCESPSSGTGSFPAPLVRVKAFDREKC